MVYLGRGGARQCRDLGEPDPGCAGRWHHLCRFWPRCAAAAELVVTGPAPCSETLQIARRADYIQRVEGAAEDGDAPPEELARIQREATLVANARAPSMARPS